MRAPAGLLLHCLSRLRDVDGGDETRFALLAGIMGARLVGRSGLPREALGLMRAVLGARGIPLPDQARNFCRTWQPCILVSLTQAPGLMRGV